MKKVKFYKKDGSEDTARQERCTRLMQSLAPLRNTSVYCPTLDRNVLITNASIEEIAYHASRNTKSTAAALDIVHQIKIAKHPHFDIPKQGNQRKRFHFDMTITMEGRHGKDKTRLTVGVRASGSVLQYCLTVPPE